MSDKRSLGKAYWHPYRIVHGGLVIDDRPSESGGLAPSSSTKDGMNESKEVLFHSADDLYNDVTACMEIFAACNPYGDGPFKKLADLAQGLRAHPNDVLDVEQRLMRNLHESLATSPLLQRLIAHTMNIVSNRALNLVYEYANKQERAGEDYEKINQLEAFAHDVQRVILDGFPEALRFCGTGSRPVHLADRVGPVS